MSGCGWHGSASLLRHHDLPFWPDAGGWGQQPVPELLRAERGWIPARSIPRQGRVGWQSSGHCPAAERWMPVSWWLVALVQGWLLPAMPQVPMDKVSASQGSASVPPRCRAGVSLANAVAAYSQV